MRFSTGQALVLVGVLVAIFASIYLWSQAGDRDFVSNLIAEVVGLGLSLPVAYFIVDRRLEQERRKHLQPVELNVLELLVVSTVALLRMVGSLVNEAPPPSPQKTDEVALWSQLDAFAKRVKSEGIVLPWFPDLQPIVRFVQSMSDVSDDVLALAGRYPYVFEAHPDLGRLLVELSVARSKVKSASYWLITSDVTEQDFRRAPTETALQALVGVLDQLAEEASRQLERLRPDSRPHP